MKTSRRSFIKGSAIAAAAAIAGRSFSPSLLRARPLVAGNQLRIPSEFSGGMLTAASGSAEIWSGAQTAIYGLNGAYLGPTIRMNRGDRFTAELRNQLAGEDLILHWHGILTPEEMDGHPHYAIGPGESYAYDFPVGQRAGTYWYHSHTDMITGPQVYKGLAGLFIVHDEEEIGLGLPTGEYDIPLVIQDKRITDDFQLLYNLTPLDRLRGWQGDTILVNGTPDAFLPVATTLYRFRLLNAANARVWRIAFSDGRSFHVIGTDGGLIDAPAETASFFLPPGARVEILVDFANGTLGSEIVLQSTAFDGDSIPGTRQGKPADLMRFVVDREGSSGSAIPQTLTPIPSIDPMSAVRTREFTLHSHGGRHAINNLTFDMMRVDFEVPMNEVEIWDFNNPSQEIHPMHVHGVHFQVLSRNGNNTLAPEEQGWKDTVLLFPHDRVQVALSFNAYPGTFLLHCHNLEHEDDGMMMNFLVTPPASVGGGNDSSGALGAWPNPASDRTLLQFAPARSKRQMLLSDELGRSVLRMDVPARSERMDLNLGGLMSGRYWCRIGSEAVRIVVAK